MEYHRNEELNCGKKRKKNISVIPGESDSLARVYWSIRKQRALARLENVNRLAARNSTKTRFKEFVLLQAGN
ncbi:hypothetical protein OUZ56_013860 [Daphnia magna]|uniref:Uncharacterized protein n=1 Tax=Daphnia magna TaxID=35525 RepID=A0ABQ9Z753_9CRUS|nr:hypothetical protein OUZ56_013860 [Daphnia magna]